MLLLILVIEKKWCHGDSKNTALFKIIFFSDVAFKRCINKVCI